MMLIGILGCHSAPPPAPPPPPPPPVVEAPPPPPKCESPEEGCVARADTRARIKQVGWEIAPPEGWTYAQEEEATVATGKSAVLGVTSFDAANVKAERAGRDGVLVVLAEKLGVSLPKKKTYFAKKPDQKQKVGDVDVELYQVDGAKRDGKKGPLLIFSARMSSEHVLLGAGFVADDDADKSDEAIMKAIESIGRAAEPTELSKSTP
jgi:hypothetical protein